MTTSSDEFVPHSQPDLVEWLREAALKPPRGVFPAGGRTAVHFGYPHTLPGETVCLSRLTRIVDYPARDMTITVEAGLRVEELARVLAAEHQRLAVDVSESHRATLGGAIATNTSGPRRYGLGTLRDYVIGVSAADAAGRIWKAGGRVVKNVAGYDLCKMLIGSLGTLAIVIQVTLKLKPLPEASGLLWSTFAQADRLDQTLQQLLTSEARPVALDVLDERAARTVARETGLDLPAAAFVLVVGIEGTSREVAWQVDRLQSELARSAGGMVPLLGPPAETLWAALIDFEVPAEEPLTFKANLRPSRTVEFLSLASNAGITLQAHAGNGIVVGHLPDEVATAAAARTLLEPLRSLVREASGNLVILSCDDEWKQELPVFGDPGPADPLMRTLKQRLDARNVLNPGRLFRD